MQRHGSRLGVKVTVVELLDDVLMLLDKDVRLVEKHMEKEGVSYRTCSRNIKATKKKSQPPPTIKN